ncbi:MAG: Rieske 2Fe-2S domain-containing protein, partial [Chloroflexota bacterium]
MGQPAFARNAWYAAAWSAEIGHGLIQRWLLDEPVALYRTSAGAVTALGDRCPHRRFPLSQGQLVGDSLQCGYHGFTFDPSGACL